MQNESTELNHIFEALAKAQQEMELASLDKKNPFFKSQYADLASVVRASRPYLAKNGLSVIQRVLTKESGQMVLSTRLGHASGQWIESEMAISPPKNDIQSLGSYITYLRRYNYSAIVGVASGDDDDGEKAMERSGMASRHRNPEKIEYISDEQVIEIEKKINDEISFYDSYYRQRALERFNIDSFSNLEAKHFEPLMKNIQAKVNEIQKFYMQEGGV